MKRKRAHYPIRSHERGAAIFIVVMAIMLLTSVGVFSIYSAGLTARGAGFQRLSAQALYTAELGVLTGTGFFSVPGYADANYKQANQDLANGTADECEATPANTFCKKILMGDIDTALAAISAPSILDMVNAQGSMSPYPATDPDAVEGDFVLEMTDPRPVDVPGSELGSGNYQRITLTSYGMVRPLPVSGAMCTGVAGQNKLAARRLMRAHVIVGPIQ